MGRANTQYNLAVLLRPQRVAPKLGIDTSGAISPRDDGPRSPEPTPETPSIILSTFKNSPYMITDDEESRKVTDNVGLIVAPAVDTKLAAQKRREARRRAAKQQRREEWEGALSSLQRARDATPGHSKVLAELAGAFTMLARHSRSVCKGGWCPQLPWC